MKKILHLALALVLLAGLAACGGGKEGWDTSIVQTLLDSGAFSEELEELDLDTAFVLYQLADCGLTPEQLNGGAVHRSAGATCEELTCLALDSETSAESAKGALEDYIQSQIDSNRDYRPGEISKLENAYISQRGRTLLLVVANDLSVAKETIK